MRSKISDMRDEISILRDIASQIVSIREMMENLGEGEVSFLEKKLKEIIDKYEKER